MGGPIAPSCLPPFLARQSLQHISTPRCNRLTNCCCRLPAHDPLRYHPQQAGSAAVNLTFLQTMFTDDYVRLSRPVYYVDVSIAGSSSSSSSYSSSDQYSVFVAFSAEHAVNSDSQQVAWAPAAAGTGPVRLGNAQQNVLGSKGDGVNIDWGFLYIQPPTSSTGSRGQSFVGSLAQARAAFVATSQLPTTADARTPRLAGDDLPAVSATATVGGGSGGGGGGHATLVVAYDDVKSVNYFGDEYAGFWTQTYTGGITQAMAEAAGEYDAMLQKSVDHDQQLVQQLEAAGGPEYAQVGRGGRGGEVTRGTTCRCCW
jgi:hypothetical protein